MAKAQSGTHSRASYNDLTAYHAMMPHMERYLAMLEASGGYDNERYGKTEYGGDGQRGGYTPSPVAPKGIPYNADAALKLGFGIGVGYAMAMRDRYGKDGAPYKHCATCSCGDNHGGLGKPGGLESRLGYGKEAIVGRNQENKKYGTDDKYKYH